MSQSPVHLRPKAKRALNWDAKPRKSLAAPASGPPAWGSG